MTSHYPTNHPRLKAALATACLAIIVTATGCQQQSAPTVVAGKSSAPKFPTTILAPPIPQGVQTSLTNPHGDAVSLDCKSCHAVREPDRTTANVEKLDQFHQGLHFTHGTLKCVSCHNTDDGYSTLHLADGTAIEFADSMTLCAQCHGTQHTDYQHGAHGGMTGYWDLTRGPRVRNHCLHCHDPHTPKYPVVQPVAPPRDRFAPADANAHHE